jgi:hypothetical protein
VFKVDLDERSTARLTKDQGAQHLQVDSGARATVFRMRTRARIVDHARVRFGIQARVLSGPRGASRLAWRLDGQDEVVHRSLAGGAFEHSQEPAIADTHDQLR